MECKPVTHTTWECTLPTRRQRRDAKRDKVKCCNWKNEAGKEFPTKSDLPGNNQTGKPKTPTPPPAPPPVDDPDAPLGWPLVDICVDPACVPMTHADIFTQNEAAFNRINELRALETPPAPPLIWSEQLAHAAMMHSVDHTLRGFGLSHNVPSSPWGVSPSDRANNSGWPTEVSLISENISVTSNSHTQLTGVHPSSGDPLALTQSLAQIDIWRNTHIATGFEGHHVNNMRPEAVYVGIAYYMQPKCMLTGPGYLDNPGNEDDHALNPYNSTDRPDAFNGETLGMQIYGRGIVVALLSTDIAPEVPDPAPEMFDTCQPDTYLDTTPIGTGDLGGWVKPE